MLTRLPLAAPEPDRATDLARATRAFPLAGALIGLIGATAFWISDELGLPPLAGALLALAATTLITGGFHEDGLADTADGLGAAVERQRRLEIMRDSRSGVYGVLSLVFTVGLKAAALSALAADGWAPAALIAAHAVARGFLPAVMAWLPLARGDGLAVSTGQPVTAQGWIALALGAVIALVLLGIGATLAAMIAAGLTTISLAALARARLGGYTGDVLGAIEQVGEVAVLLTAAAVL